MLVFTKSECDWQIIGLLVIDKIINIKYYNEKNLNKKIDKKTPIS